MDATNNIPGIGYGNLFINNNDMPTMIVTNERGSFKQYKSNNYPDYLEELEVGNYNFGSNISLKNIMDLIKDVKEISEENCKKWYVSGVYLLHGNTKSKKIKLHTSLLLIPRGDGRAFTVPTWNMERIFEVSLYPGEFYNNSIYLIPGEDPALRRIEMKELDNYRRELLKKLYRGE